MSASLKPKKRQKLQYPTTLPHWKGLEFLPDNKGVRKTDSWGDEFRVARTIELFNYLKNNPHPTIVPILDYCSLAPSEYSYDMPLMAKLSNSESELAEIYSDGPEARKIEKNKIYRLKKKHPKLYQVLVKLDSWKTYVDLHEGNVMRDRYGNYKLIDIEGFGLTTHSVQTIIDDITKK